MAEENVIDALCNRIKYDKEIFGKSELGRNEIVSFNLVDFWTQFGVAVQALNNEVTKIGFACGKKPFPKPTEVRAMLQSLQQYYSVMRDFYLVLPKEIGATLLQAVTSTVGNILASLSDFVKSLHELSEKGAKERLVLTGTFWDACNAVDSLPRDNLKATLNVLETEEALAKDAYEELETTLQEISDDDDTWTDSERELATRSLGLVKVTRTCLTRLRQAVREDGSCVLPLYNIELDNTAAIARNVSPALDDFVSELYHPVDFPTVYENAAKLVEVLRSVLSSVRESHYAAAFGSETINKLEHFIKHNHQKLDPSKGTDPLPQFASLSVNSNLVSGSMHPYPATSKHREPAVDICNVCGEIISGNDSMKPESKEKKKKEKDTAEPKAKPTVPPPPPPTSGVCKGPPHSRSTDVIVIMFLALFSLIYLLIKDWLLIVINCVLLCLYVFSIRRRLPVPAYGTMDLQEYFAKIS